MHEASRLRVAIFAGLALIGFAANSLLCRAALGSRSIDAASFTSIRIASGAAVLAILSRIASRRSGSSWSGSWKGALALVAYAVFFSFAYLELHTGVGALILFGSVQVTMIGVGLYRGERPFATEWIGLLLAFGGLVILTAPGASAPAPLGALLMAVAGVSWGFYSLLGRGQRAPLASTADNFLGAVPIALLASAIFWSARAVSFEGALLAVASGSLASGVGYSLWYAALPRLSATRAAIVQLSVPVVAAAGGVAVLSERVELRLVLAAATILGGVGLALAGRRRGG